MINLLFISNSPRAELLRVHFQQILKIRIDVVEDFDHGLKDVFEKRPVAVCIQEQIAGVTGESVARHIQLLLGNSAPSFILMHEGSTKAKLVPGLFSHLVDLNAPFEVVCETLRKALQALLGEHWDIVYSALPEPELRAIVPGSAIESALADQLVDDFIAENSIFTSQNIPPLPDPERDLAVSQNNPFEQELPGGPPAEPYAARVKPVSSFSDPETLEAPVPRDPLMAGKQPPAFLQQPVLEPSVRPAQQEVASVAFFPEEPPEVIDESAPVEELLLIFEEKYRRRKRMVQRIIIVVTLLFLLGLLLVWLQQRGTFGNQTVGVIKQQLPDRPQQVPSAQPVVSSTTSAALAVPSAIPKAAALPSFVSQAKPDPDFSSKKPGWSRYLAAQRDYRLFYADGRLQAVQVLAAKNGSIGLSELKQILHELTGKDQYRSGGQERKGGIWVERASVPGQADLLIYRSTSKGPIQAFVFAPTP